MGFVNSSAVALAVVASLGLTGAALAQTAPRDEVSALLGQPSAAIPTPAAAEPETDEVRTTRALNAEVTAQYELSQSQTQADQDAETRRQAEMADQYSRETAEVEARNLAAQRQAEDLRRQYEFAMADWRATVRACEVGDRARCRAGSLTPSPAPPPSAPPLRPR